MSEENTRRPILDRYYQQYLSDEKTADFITAVSKRYTTATLERIALHGDCISRRAATLAIGFVADYQANAALGRGLHDKDRGVRMLAENGIREIWRRMGDDSQRQKLDAIFRLNISQQFFEAIRRADELIEEAPWFAEAWNQRAIAYYQINRYIESANDCHQALEINPYHFAAAVGMGHCYLEMDDIHSALECFRRALKLNPDMEDVRLQIKKLRRSLEEK